MKTIRKILVTVFLLGFLLASCASAPAMEPIIGNIIQKNGLAVKVYDTEEAESLVGFAASYSAATEEGYEFFIVDASIFNSSKKQITLDSDEILLKDSQGQVYTLIGICSRSLYESEVWTYDGTCEVYEGFHFISDMAPWEVEYIDQLLRGYVFAIPSDSTGLVFKVGDLPVIDLGR